MTLTAGCGRISNVILVRPVILSQPVRAGELAMKPARRKKEKSGSSSSRGVASSPATSTAHLSSADPIPRSPSCDEQSGSGKLFTASRFSWRSKTWQSDSPSKLATEKVSQPAEPTSPSIAYQSSRKHSLTVPGEPRYSRCLSQSFTHLMGHQQKHSTSASEPTSLESKKLQRSRSPSPLSTPSPSGSASLAGDDHSACSSCSSGGLSYDLARKCTLSADSLLLRPDDSSRARSSRAIDFKKISAEEPAGTSRSGHHHRHHLQPESSTQRKITSSVSSDQIHTHLMTSESIDGTRSASPKLTGKKSTPEPIEEPTASTSRAGSSSREEKRKGSVASQVFSGPGRLARLLRRTHSAGCSKDIPPYALFLREKSSRGSRPKETGSGSGSEKRRTRKQPSGLGDMRQRLRFLGRRHTDSSISSVRPTPEEATKWAESFTFLMSHKYGASLFTAFLKMEFSQENIEFWTEVENYKKSKPSRLTSKAKKIYDEYIAVKSAKEINIEVSMRQSIQANLTAADDKTFDVAQRKIQGLLESDAYVRFLQSDLYKELLVPPQPPALASKRPTSLGKAPGLSASPSASSTLISPSAIVKSLSRSMVCIEKETESAGTTRSPESNL